MSYLINNQNKQNISLAAKFFSIGIPWISWLNIYATPLPGVSLGYLALLLIIAYLTIYSKGKVKIKEHKWLICYYTFAILSLPISTYYSDEIIELQICNRVAKEFILIYLVCFLIPQYLHWEYFKKSLSIISSIAAFAILIQFLQLKFIGIPTEFKIPFLNYCNEWSNVKDFSEIMASTGRLTSIFLEPSHFTMFIIPYIIILLFDNKKHILLALLFSFSAIIAVSSSGIICLIIIWIIFLGKYFFYKSLPQRKLYALLFLLLIIPIIVELFFYDSQISFAIERLLPSYTNQANVWKKIYGGALEFERLSAPLKLIGSGLGNIHPVFMTGYYMVLNYTGYIGLFIVFIWYIKMFFRSNLMGKTAILIFSITFLIQPIFFAPGMINYIALTGGYNERRSVHCS